MNNLVSKYAVWYPAFFLRGQKKVWNQAKFFNKTPYYEPEHLRICQFGHFKKILSFAYRHIPFYKKKYEAAGIHPDHIRSPDDMDKIPVLTKKEIRENGNKVCNKHYSGLKFRRHTSGSTGNPMTFYKDALSMTVMDAILYRNYAWLGIDIGFRQARFWGHPLSRTGSFKTRMADSLLNRVRLSAFYLEEKNYRCYLAKIERFKSQYIYGYAQSVFQFAHYFHRKNRDLSYLNLKGVILTGEMIYPGQIEVIKKVFGCEVAEEYGCTELGVIAFRCGCGNMHLMENLLTESVYDPSDKTQGNIIVSELYGELFPFIRYQIGDRGSISYRKCSCGRNLPILDNIAGRKDSFIKCPDGKLADPCVLSYILDAMPAEYGSISQYRIIQEQIDRLKVCLVAKGDKEKIEEYNRREFCKVLAENMETEVCFFASLPKNNSGKLACFVSKLEGSVG
jgi:phenylacetate-CoA ligase